MEEYEATEAFAYIKYEGELVRDGFLDARKAGEALLGIDEALRFFISHEDPSLQLVDFEIPVRVRKGSWETIFLENFDALLLKTAVTWGATKYFGTALEEIAKNDFKELGFKDIFKSAFKAMTWVIKLAKHLGSLANKKLDHFEFTGDGKVAVENNEGETLAVPAQYLKLFAACPNDLFSKLARVIEDERELVIGYKDKDDSNFVRVKLGKKFIFIPNEDESEILFPELVHNSYVELSGHVSRGNENSNTLGFLYQDHVLTCYPSEGNIKSFKGALFTNAIVKGYVDRLDKKTGELIEKRPRIRFLEVVSTEPDNRQLKLF
ncbi:hypothetical protein [Pontibacter akesuensis]|uniref:Uncharacterized protein n=1 Tax=Pontibacter akesuensis TaxID=388950 RepID=A0A1I7IBB6_9BACT|nr:hypothetical protein [Pontibacter akesuensis]GHA66180.1 hypothetical protein GCM10007389_19020 [Pontibacter akesuensis]SFU70237.1 hypothetical protein SAMN04487941_2069 [Pontibacter akesuensis]